MRKRKSRNKREWLVNLQSVYIFAKEKKLEAAYEIILSTQTIELKGTSNVSIKNKFLFESIK